MSSHVPSNSDETFWEPSNTAARLLGRLSFANSCVISVLAFALNALLIVVLVRRVMAQLGRYKYVMVLAAGSDLLFSVSNFVTSPMMTAVVAGEFQALLIASNGLRVPFWVGVGFIMVSLAFLTQAILLPPVQFYFRYMQICRSYDLQIHGRHYKPLLVAPALALVFGAGMLSLVSYPTPTDIFFNSGLVDALTGVSHSGFIVISYTKYKNTFYEKTIAAATVLVALFYISLLFVSFSIMSFCSYYIVRKLAEQRVISAKTYRLQKKFYRMISLQFLCPFLLLHLPFLKSCIGPMFGLAAKGVFNIALPFFFVWTPFLNAIIVLTHVCTVRPLTCCKLGIVSPNIILSSNNSVPNLRQVAPA